MKDIKMMKDGSEIKFPFNIKNERIAKIIKTTLAVIGLYFGVLLIFAGIILIPFVMLKEWCTVIKSKHK